MNDRSARPSLTASRVCGAATTDLGSRLHFTRPCVTFSMSLQNGMVMSATSRCAGGTHAVTFSMVSAWAPAAGSSSAPPSIARASFLDFIVASRRFFNRCANGITPPTSIPSDPRRRTADLADGGTAKLVAHRLENGCRVGALGLGLLAPGLLQPGNALLDFGDEFGIRRDDWDVGV